MNLQSYFFLFFGITLSCRDGKVPRDVQDTSTLPSQDTSISEPDIQDTGIDDSGNIEDSVDDSDLSDFCERDLSGQGNDGTCFTKNISCGDEIEMNLEEGTNFYDFAFYEEDSDAIAAALGERVNLSERAFFVDPLSHAHFRVTITEYCDDISLIVYPWTFRGEAICPTTESEYGDREWTFGGEEDPSLFIQDTQCLLDLVDWIFIVEGRGNFKLVVDCE